MIKQNLNYLPEKILPVDIVLGPPWWYKHTGITFDQDFFFHPVRRVEAEQKMEQVLYEKWGKFGLGRQKNEKRPEIGAVHLAAGFMLSEMLGCQVNYLEDNPPQVVPLSGEKLRADNKSAFNSPVYKKFELLLEKLKGQFGYLSGDVNWGGILNIAMDLRGQDLFFDMVESPDHVEQEFSKIRDLIDRFVGEIQQRTGTSSISVNRNVVHFKDPIFLHSECSHTMISVEHYEQFLFPFDHHWSLNNRPFGIHYCGSDAHRYAESFARLPHLDFLDVGWGGDVKILRQHLPDTFFNIRLNPALLADQTTDEIRKDIRRLVKDSANNNLTGVCCINMDDKVSDDKIDAIFTTVEELRQENKEGIIG